MCITISYEGTLDAHFTQVDYLGSKWKLLVTYLNGSLSKTAFLPCQKLLSAHEPLQFIPL